MSKIFEFIGGSYLDRISSTLGVNTNGRFRHTGSKGFVWEGNSGNSISYTGLSFDLIDLITECKGIGTLRITIGSTNNDIILTNNTWQFEKDTFILSSQTTITITVISGYAYISRIFGFDHSLITLEVDNLYKDFLRPKGTGASIRKNNYPIKSNDMSRLASNGLIASYNMKPAPDSTLEDISGNGENGTIVGAISTKNGMSFINGNYIGLSTLNIGSVHTINAKVLTKDLSGLNTLLGDAANSQIRFNSTSSYYRVGAVTQSLDYALLENTYITITIRRTNLDIDLFINGINVSSKILANNSDFIIENIGRRGLNDLFWIGNINDIQIWNKAQTEQEILDYHNQFEGYSIIEDFQNEAVGNSPREWIKDTGEYEVKEETDGFKYLECISPGLLLIQADSAYGQIEFNLYRRNDGTNPIMQIIQDRRDFLGDGYNLQFKSDESIELDKITDGAIDTVLFTTIADYINYGFTYRIKFEREENGKFSIYIRGEEFGDDYVLVNPDGGSGTNPITDNTYGLAAYVGVNFDIGDRLGGILAVGRGAKLPEFYRITSDGDFRITTDGSFRIYED